MASNGNQSGYDDAPAFPGGDAPQTGPDLEEVARYAWKRGNLLRGTNAEMNDYDHFDDGVAWADTTNSSLMVDWGSGPVQHGIEHLATDTSTSPTQGSITTTPTTVANISISVTLARTSTLRVRGIVSTYSSAVNDVLQILLKDGATTVSEWTMSANSSPGITATSQTQYFEVPLVGVSAGTHTYTVQVVRVAGSGNLTIAPSAASPNWLTVERIA